MLRFADRESAGKNLMIYLLDDIREDLEEGHRDWYKSLLDKQRRDDAELSLLRRRLLQMKQSSQSVVDAAGEDNAGVRLHRRIVRRAQAAIGHVDALRSDGLRASPETFRF